MGSLHLVSYALAMIGDAFNMAGAFVLAWDVLGRERERKTMNAAIGFVKKLQASGSGAGIDDPEISLIRDAVRLGKRGCALIFVGFMMLMMHRGLEIYDIVQNNLTRK